MHRSAHFWKILSWVLSGKSAIIFFSTAVPLAVVGPCPAITITLDYQDENNSEDPAFDPNGAKLIAAMQAAANHWSSIIQDGHHLTIRFWYDNLDDTTLANANDIAATDHRTTVGRIKFDTRDTDNVLRNWYFDPTPSNDSEFDMRHLSFATDGEFSWFSESPLNGLEIGYRGFAMSGPAQGKYDVYSTALHEMGHLLGLLDLVDGIAETADGDYDLPPSLMNNDTAAVRTASPPPFDDVNEYAHIRPPTALMCNGCASTSLRRMPSALDILAAASVSGWSNIDLPRKMFVQNKDFNTASNWLDSQIPGVLDDAYVTAGGSFLDPITLSADKAVRNVTVIDTYLSTHSHVLTVFGTTTIDSASTFGALRVPADGELRTHDLDINDNSLSPDGGTVVVSGQLRIAEDARIDGHGTIRLESNPGEGLNNNGELRVNGQGTLVLTTPSPFTPAVIDLDGTTGDGVVDLQNGDLLVKRFLTDPFDGLLKIARTRTATFEKKWVLGTSGTVRMTGSDDVATLAGNEATVRGTIIVNQTAHILGPVILEPSAVISFNAGAPPTLLLGDTTTYRGPTIGTEGELIQNGDAIVELPTVLAPSLYDWDGNAAPSDTLVDATTFEINAPQIESGDPALEGYGGTATLTDATLEVNTVSPWRLDGQIAMSNSTIRGTGMLNHGTVRGDGLVMPIDLVNDGSVVGDGDTLILQPRNFPDLDGSQNDGALRAVGGNIHVPGNYQALFPFEGILSTGQGHEYRMDYFGLDNHGQMAMSGGKYVAPQLHQNGLLTVRQNPSVLETESEFFDDSTSTLLANLVIDGHATFHPSASVTGDGSLIVAQDSSADGEAFVGVDVFNQGRLEPGFSTGVFTVDADFGQTSTGLLDIELGGLLAGDEYDRLVVTGDMRLSGELQVRLIDNHDPVSGSVYDIMDFATVIGEFSVLDLAPLTAGRMWNTSKLYLTGEIRVVPEPGGIGCLLSALAVLLACRTPFRAAAREPTAAFGERHVGPAG